MPFKYNLITEIDRPPSLYGKLTKGTIFEPWLYQALINHQYFNKPINVWERHSGLAERIARAGHIGVVIGTVTGVVQAYFYNIAKGYRGPQNFNHIGTYRMLGSGMLMGLLQTTACTLTVSGMSALKHEPDDSFDWYLGGMSMAVVSLLLSQTKEFMYSRKWNWVMVLAVPLLPCSAKYLRFLNNYEDPKGGRFAMNTGGPQYRSPAEFRALYGDEPHRLPLERYLCRDETELLFLKPRQNPKWNDKFRVDEAEVAEE